jgi:RNA chaperone Hfq
MNTVKLPAPAAPPKKIVVDPHSVQKAMLRRLCVERTPVVVTMMAGTTYRGIIAAFDVYTIRLEHNGRPLLLFKHAISLIEESAAE